MVSMVHFTDAGPVNNRCLTGPASEETVEIGIIFKAKTKSNFFYRQIRMKKEAPGFQHQPLVNMYDGRLAALLFYYLAEMAWRHIHHGSIICYFMQIGKVRIDICL